MRRKGIYVIQIALSLVIVCGLAVSCAVPSAESTPASTYPADISGYVTIAEKIKATTAIPIPPSEDSDVFWIVEVLIKNNAYRDPVEVCLERHPEGWELPVYKDWEIVANNKVYKPEVSSSIDRINIALGRTGRVMFHFIVPRTLEVSDAQICYKGQEPYSYGKLSLADKVAVYDWDLKEVVEEPRYVPVSPPAEYECPKPHGLYSAITLVGEETAEFKNDEFIRFNPAVGKFVYIYRILDGCTKIELTDVVTGDIEVYDFKYSEEYGYVVIDGWSTYWKE